MHTICYTSSWVSDGSYTYPFKNWAGCSSGMKADKDYEFTATYTSTAVPKDTPSDDGSSSSEMCGSAIAAIVISMCAVLAIFMKRYLRP